MGSAHPTHPSPPNHTGVSPKLWQGMQAPKTQQTQSTISPAPSFNISLTLSHKNRFKLLLAPWQPLATAASQPRTTAKSPSGAKRGEEIALYPSNSTKGSATATYPALCPSFTSDASACGWSSPSEAFPVACAVGRTGGGGTVRYTN